MSSRLLTVMAGYSAESSIPRSSQLWVNELRRHSHHLLLVFDNPPPAQLPPDWHGEGLTVAFERHGGYDFGSYRRGLEQAQALGLLEQVNHVLLCNDSVLGPLGDLGPLLQHMQALPDQAWGLTASHQLTPHLQSYFVVFSCELLKRAPLQNFFQNIEPLPSRSAVIQRYELGLSRALLAAGASLKAWVEPQQLLNPRTGKPASNPMAFPLSLVELGVPLIKARALREPDANQEGIAASCQLIATLNPELWEAIWADTPSRRFWQHQLRIGVLLPETDVQRLNERLAWLEDQAQPGVKLLLSVPEAARQQQAQLRRDYADPIAEGQLQLLQFLDTDQPVRQLQQTLTTADVDWVCLPTTSLWTNLLDLSLQAKQLAAEPTLPYSHGEPKLWHRLSLLSLPDEGLHRLVLALHETDVA